MRKASVVAPVHAYPTTVVASDGSFAVEISSFPGYFEDRDPAQEFERLSLELDLQQGAEVTADNVIDLLTQISYETGAAKRAPLEVRSELIATVAQEPLVIREQSAPTGSSLVALLSQGVPGYILFAEGRPFLALGVEGALFLVWFISGPVKGLREAAHDATKTVATELLEDWLRKRITRGRRRRS
jgi:hypothetical protein